MTKFILLSFDVEEFDIPEEYGQKIDEQTKYEVSLTGLKNILGLLDKLNIRATFFVTANFALKYQKLIKEISKKHEISSHTYSHSSFSIKDLKKSKKVLESITKKEVFGLRVPRFKKIDKREVKKAGYKYDSSLNPTYIPGKYNNIFKKRTMHYDNGILVIPISATPLVRFPVFWLSLKNFPAMSLKIASKIILNSDSYLNVFFHPWEFADISGYKLPLYVKNCCGGKMSSKLELYLNWLKTQGSFVTFSEFINERNLISSKNNY